LTDEGIETADTIRLLLHMHTINDPFDYFDTRREELRPILCTTLVFTNKYECKSVRKSLIRFMELIAVSFSSADHYPIMTRIDLFVSPRRMT